MFIFPKIDGDPPIKTQGLAGSRQTPLTARKYVQLTLNPLNMFLPTFRSELLTSLRVTWIPPICVCTPHSLTLDVGAVVGNRDQLFNERRIIGICGLLPLPHYV